MFREWVTRHGRIFGFTEANVLMLISWEGLFAASNYTAEELAHATDTLSLKPPAFAKDHLAAIREAITSRRAATARKADEVDNWQCDDCHGSGFICVPMHFKGEDWIPYAAGGCAAHYHTLAVLCHCFRGTSKVQKELKSMTFADYNARNPSWRRQLADRENEQREAAALVPASDSWTKLIDRMTATMKAKREEERR